VVGPEFESVLFVQSLGQRTEEAIGRFDHSTAHLADEVLMRVVEEVVDGPAVSEVHMVDDAEFLQRIERSVDGRPVDIRVRSLDGLGQVVRRHVVIGLHQRGDERSPRRSDPPPGTPQPVDDPLGSTFLHLHKGSG
jgi:hypothetical protein